VNEGTLSLAKDSTASVHAIGSTLIVNSNGIAILEGTGGDQLYLGANVQINGNGVLNMNGWSDGFNGLSGSGGTLLNNSATAALVTIGQNNGSGTYFGRSATAPAKSR